MVEMVKLAKRGVSLEKVTPSAPDRPNVQETLGSILISPDVPPVFTFKILGQPLKGVVASISGYVGRERKFLSELLVALGGVSQETFARRDGQERNVLRSTHLVCPDAEGFKYNAARKWKVTVV